MGLTLGNTYILKNKNSGKCLNIYGSDISEDSNVVQWTYDVNKKDKDQHWKLISTGGYYYLETVYSSNHVLDAYKPNTTSANADIWSKLYNGSQKLSISLVSGNIYTVKLADYNLYLTAIGTGNGTKSGWSTTSDGNVCWLPSKGSSNLSQQWEFIDLTVDTSYPTTSIHNLFAGGVYKIQNTKTHRNMNLWNGDTSKNSNVVQWHDVTGDIQQYWTLVNGSGTYNYLEYYGNPSYVLDAYSPNSTAANADVWTKGDDNAQQLVIRAISSSQFTISLKHYPNLFLTAIGDTDGTQNGYTSTSPGNICWLPYNPTNTAQIWDFINVNTNSSVKKNNNLEDGKTYHIRNVKTNKSANLWNGDTANATSNVVQWENNTSDTQQNWIFKNGGSSYDYFIYGEAPKFYLDAYMPNSTSISCNADVWESDPKAQKLIISKVRNGAYTISLIDFPKLYLTAVAITDLEGKYHNGTKSGVSTTSPGNIYWGTYTGDDNQLWYFESNNITAYTPKKNHSLVNGKIYHIINSETAKAANLWNGDTANATSNVVQWDNDPNDSMQNWTFITGDSQSDRFAYSDNSEFYLDAYAPKTTSISCNTDVWQNDPNAQKVVISKVSGNRHTISLLNFPKLFLTAVNIKVNNGYPNGTKSGYTTTSAGNIYWGKYTGNDNQLWTFGDTNTIGKDIANAHNAPKDSVKTYNISCSQGYLNVTSGIDRDGNSVLAYTKDGTIDQVFRLDDKGGYAYLRAQCSSDGNNRVLDALRPGATITNGTKAQIYTQNDDTAQKLHICPTGTGKYVIALESTNKKSGSTQPYGPLVLTSKGNGKGAVFAKYTANDATQHWSFSPVTSWTVSETPPTNPPPTGNGIFGIDISYHQGNISDANWKSIKDAGVKFAILRAGVIQDRIFGSLFKPDTQFKNYIEGATKAGIAVGVYIFSYIENENDIVDATNAALKFIEPYKSKIQYPVTFDIEDDPDYDVYYSRKTRKFNTNLVRQFCKIVKNAGYIPMWYTFISLAVGFINSKELVDEGYDLWLANPSRLQYTTTKYTIDQFTHSGSIPGISTNVDCNYSYFDYTNGTTPGGGTTDPGGGTTTPGDGTITLAEIHKRGSQHYSMFGSKGMTQEQLDTVLYIKDYFMNTEGWSLNAVCALLGNMDGESEYNVTQEETGNGSGYGLVQWTPMQKLIDRCNEFNLGDYKTKETQCKLIQHEMETPGLQYDTKRDPTKYDKYGGEPTGIGKISGNQFMYGNNTLDELTFAFMVYYEYPSVYYNGKVSYHWPRRKYVAEQWYELFSKSSSGGTNPGGGTTNTDGFSISTTPPADKGNSTNDYATVTGFKRHNPRKFHKGSGMVSGDYKSNNNGNAINNAIEKFFKHVFRVNTASEEQYTALLYGDNFDAMSKPFHQGLDMSHTNNDKIYSAHSGIIEFLDNTYYGQVGIKDKDTGVSYVYAHMEINPYWINKYNNNKANGIKTEITFNDDNHLGLMRGKGANGDINTFKDWHLHFEVRPNGSSKMGSYVNANEAMNALIPYGFINKFI